MNSFWRGIASIFSSIELYNSYPKSKLLNMLDNDLERDKKALKEDWKKVGEDMNQAINTFKNRSL